MKIFYLFIILILLILVVYYHNKSIAYQTFEHFDDNMINQLASIINGNNLKIKNLEITETLTAPNITTRNVYSTDTEGKWVDFNCKPVFYEDTYAKKKLEAPNLYTYYITSTGGENSWLDLRSHVHMYKGGYTNEVFEKR